MIGKVPPEGNLIEDSDLDEQLVDVGDTLCHIRVAQRVRLVDLADRGDMSREVLSKIERGGRYERGLRQLYVIAGLLGVRLSDILRFSESCVLDGRSPWPFDGTNSPLVEAILSTAPERNSRDSRRIQPTRSGPGVRRAE